MYVLHWIDYLFLFCISSIWLLLLYNALLTYYGYKYFNQLNKLRVEPISKMQHFPLVSILIPAHNEEKVIARTVRAILRLDYPATRMEIIVINDNSQDRTGEILQKLQKEFGERKLKIITTDKTNGGRGKSNALNIGFREAKGELIVVYDADNTPEPMALRYLVHTILSSSKYGAVIGKFRTRNKQKNLLTKFINIEGLSFQWMAQGGRWMLFNLCTIPGTNFIIRKSVLDEIGGWDPKAIAEDTEISIRIYQLGYKICFMPLAVTWEQEPENLKTWVKQRTRWVKGNIYVVGKYLFNPLALGGRRIMLDIYYFFSIYFFFLLAILCSHLVFLLGTFTEIKVSLPGNFFLIWFLSYLMFILQINIALTMEKGEFNRENALIIALMYFTYCQLWVLISLKGVLAFFQDKIFGRQQVWYKTERF